MTLTDKEKVRKALAKITKIIDEYKSWKPPNEKDPDVIKDFEEISVHLPICINETVHLRKYWLFQI